MISPCLGNVTRNLKEDYLAFVITMVDILNGAAYLSDKKPDSDNRHWKEQQEIQEYCEAIREDIKGKEMKKSVVENPDNRYNIRKKMRNV